MTLTYRIQMFWNDRPGTIERHAEQLANFLGRLKEVHGTFARFALLDKRTDTLLAVNNRMECATALATHMVEFKTGDKVHQAYDLKFVLDRAIQAPMECSIVMGIGALPVKTFTPNRVSFTIRQSLDIELRSRQAFDRYVLAAITAFTPEWGYVGTDTLPTPPKAIFSPNLPVVGWMTYVSYQVTNLAGARFREPNVCYPLEGLGHLIVANPNVFDPKNSRHLESIALVQQTLKAAGVQLGS